DVSYHYNRRGLVRWAVHLGLIPIGITLIVVSVLNWRPAPSAPPSASAPARLHDPEPKTSGIDWFDQLQRGEWCLARGEHERALSAFELAYMLAPFEAGTGQSEVRMLLGQVTCLIALHRLDDARSQLTRAHQEMEN